MKSASVSSVDTTSETTAVMKYTKTVDDGHLLETYENDIDTPEKRDDIIERHILPYLWF